MFDINKCFEFDPETGLPSKGDPALQDFYIMVKFTVAILVMNHINANRRFIKKNTETDASIFNDLKEDICYAPTMENHNYDAVFKILFSNATFKDMYIDHNKDLTYEWLCSDLHKKIKIF